MVQLLLRFTRTTQLRKVYIQQRVIGLSTRTHTQRLAQPHLSFAHFNLMAQGRTLFCQAQVSTPSIAMPPIVTASGSVSRDPDALSSGLVAAVEKTIAIDTLICNLCRTVGATKR